VTPIWDALIADIGPYPDRTDRPIIVGLDASKAATAGADHTALCAVRREGEITRLIAHKIWKPSGHGDIDLRKTVIPWLLDLKRRYGSVRVLFDPYSMSTCAQIAREAGINMRELSQTQGNQTRFTTALLELIRSGSLRVYKADDLREQILNSVMVETSRGVRLAKEKASRKIDGAVALAMACFGAQRHGREVPEPVVHNLMAAPQLAIPQHQKASLAALFGGGPVPDYHIDK